LVHPTLEDTFGMVVLEAMAHAVPAIVSAEQYCGISAELTHLQNAWILENPTKTSKLILAVIEIFNSERYANMCSNALEWASGHSWFHLAQSQDALYNKVKTTKNSIINDHE